MAMSVNFDAIPSWVDPAASRVTGGTSSAVFTGTATTGAAIVHEGYDYPTDAIMTSWKCECGFTNVKNQLDGLLVCKNCAKIFASHEVTSVNERIASKKVSEDAERFLRAARMLTGE